MRHEGTQDGSLRRYGQVLGLLRALEAVLGGWVAEKPDGGRRSGPVAVFRFSPVVYSSFIQVFSPPRVVTWRAFEFLGGIRGRHVP